jgi:hypothetical protein
MKRSTKIIIAIIAVLAVVGSVIAGVVAAGSATPKTTANIEKEYKSAFSGAKYYKDVQVQTYSGTSATPQENENKEADSAAIDLQLNTLTASDFKDLLKRLPKMDITTYYKIAVNKKEDYTGLYGFTYKDLTNKGFDTNIASILKKRESNKDTTYLQVSAGNVTSENKDALTVSITSPVNTVEGTRKTVDTYLAKNVDVIAVNLPDIGGQSYSQNAAVEGKMDDFNKVVDFGLQFGKEVFSPTNEISVVGKDKTVTISFANVDKGITKDSLQKTADSINAGGAYGLTIKVNDQTKVQ